ncbi:MAG: YitT family protein [Clostridia bacterium]|nr:YitT family protein [Clostridia bacterium]
MKAHIKNLTADIFYILLGAAAYSAAFAVFIGPNHITPGGLTGLAALLHFLVKLPVGLGVLILNIPLFIIGYRRFDVRFILLSGVATLSVSFFLDLAELLPYTYTGDPMLAALFGGLLMGFGLALVMLRGATTGGVDIIAKLLKLRFPHILLGRLILTIDAVIIILTVFLYRDIDSALYSALALFISSRVIDAMLYGAERAKLFFIVSENAAALKEGILSEVRRGVTQISVVGGYSGHERDMLLCAVRRFETARLHRMIRATDPKAFVMIADIGEILGEGFSKIK